MFYTLFFSNKIYNHSLYLYLGFRVTNVREYKVNISILYIYTYLYDKNFN